MIYLMGFFALLFVLGLVFWFMTALREGQDTPFRGQSNRAG